jgi:phosphatidate cytidylyltransferase
MLEFIDKLRMSALLSQIKVSTPEVRWLDRPTMGLVLTVLVLLVIAYVIGRFLQKQPDRSFNPAIVGVFNRRITAWLMMWTILALGILLGREVTVLLFGLVSFWALREFITMTPTRRGDHRTLFWTFFLFTPLQYLLVMIGRSFVEDNSWYGFDFYGLYSIMIPVYASLFIPARIALSGDHKRFLERVAKIQAGLLICVYSLSYAPAMLDLDLWQQEGKVEERQQENQPPNGSVFPEGEFVDADGQRWVQWSERHGSNAGLLFYLVLLVQLGDIFQFAWDRIAGKHVIAPSISAGKTWEGFLGCVLTTSLCGVIVWFTGVTPFTWYGSALMGLVIATMGFAGSLTMSAIKRDRGVTDYGTLVQGHAGVLDRIDSMCFAAPVFFHLTRYFLYIVPMGDRIN